MRTQILPLLIGSLIISAIPAAAIESDKAAKDQPDLVEPEYREVFNNSFVGNASELIGPFFKDYKQLNPGGFELGAKGLVLKPSKEDDFILVRPMPPAGSVGRLSARMEFEGLSNEGDVSETRLGFGLANGQQARVAFSRRRAAKEVIAKLRFTVQLGDRSREVRVVPLPSDLTSGVYDVVYHHGLMRVEREGKLLGQGFADVNPNTAKLVGVIIEQAQSSECRLLSLKLNAGDPATGVVEDPEAAVPAGQATEKARQLYQTGLYDEAYPVAFEAAVLWRKARGSTSPDAANATINLAKIAEARKDFHAAAASLESTLKIREATLGTGHPLTAIAHSQLAVILLRDDKPDAARRELAAAMSALDGTFDKNDPMVQSTRELLDKLRK